MFHFRAVTCSILIHTSSWVWLLLNFTLFYIILFYAVILNRSFVLLWNQQFERPKIGWKLSDTPYLSTEMIKKISMLCKNSRENQGKMRIISLKISGKIREFCPEIVLATLHCLIFNKLYTWHENILAFLIVKLTV